MAAKKNELAKTEEAGLPDFYDEADGSGFEEASSQAFSIPFLSMLQKTSPQCDPDDGAYIEGAKAGMYYNSATGQVYESVDVVPCYFRNSMVKWRPNRGGFVGQEAPGYEQGLPRKKRDDGSETGVYIDAEGNEVVDTRYHFCLQISPDGAPLPVIISMSSTQIKKSKNWMFTMRQKQAPRKDGKGFFRLPMYSHIYRLTSAPEQNDFGNWRGFKIDEVGVIKDAGLYEAAKSAYEMFQSAADNIRPPAEGDAPATESARNTQNDPEDEIPF